MRTPSINSMRYVPTNAPTDKDDVSRWAENEFRNIKGALDIIFASGSKEKLYVAPLKPRDGDFAYADGSSWNPGYGAGLYYYNGTSWLFVSPEYITGSWTPVIDSAVAGTGRATTVLRADYTKSGDTVFFDCYCYLSTLGSGGSGPWVIKGLPFNSSSASNYVASVSVGYFANLASNVTFITGAISANASQILMKGLAAAAAGTTDLTFATYVGVNTYIAVSGHYKV